VSGCARAKSRGKRDLFAHHSVVDTRGRATVPVAVVIPAYNAEAYLAAALASVADQTVQPAQVIVVDDGSSDRTAFVATSAGARVLQQGNLGPSAARNAGVAAAHAPWVAFLDADDTWLPPKLEAQWAALSRWPDLAFCITDYTVLQPGGTTVDAALKADAEYRAIARTAIDGDAVRFESTSFLSALVRSMFVRQSSAVVRREVFLRSGGYDARYRLAEDYDLFIRLAGYAPAASIERPLVQYRRRDDSLSADPLTEIWSIDALWERILQTPQRYPAGIEDFVLPQRAKTLRKGAKLAMRLGRFSEAEPLLRKLSEIDASLTTLSFYGLWSALRSPLGRQLHQAVRATWRRRARRTATTSTRP
jgi:glycosyltransferase involved in cell wall biosynthesis